MHRLLQEFTELHEISIDAPASTRHGTSLLIAMRPWEPEVFAVHRYKPDTRVFLDK